jgi:hypothetical protein
MAWLAAGLGVAVAIALTLAALLVRPSLTAEGVVVPLFGIPVLNIDYADITRVSIERKVVLPFLTNPFRRLVVHSCLGDRVVVIRREHRWFSNVIVCPNDQEEFVREVTRRLHAPRPAA